MSFIHVVCTFNVCNLCEHLIASESGLSKTKWKSPAFSSNCLFHFNKCHQNPLQTSAQKPGFFPGLFPLPPHSHDSPSLYFIIHLLKYSQNLFHFLPLGYHDLRLRWFFTWISVIVSLFACSLILFFPWMVWQFYT